MAPNTYKHFKNMQVKLDNASGTATDITAEVNNSDLATAVKILEALSLGDTTKTTFGGIAGAKISLNGWVNSTTKAIWGPLEGTSTSITKTVGLNNGVKWLNGEYWPDSVKFSGKADDMEVWSVSLTLNGSITRTSVAPA